MNDGQERVCDGCHTTIAPRDPDAFQKGAQWFHRASCLERFQDLSYQMYLKRINHDARKVVRYHIN